MPLNGDLRNQGLLDANISVKNSLKYADGIMGKCLQFDGDPSQILSISNAPQKINNFSWCCWMRQSSATSISDGIVQTRQYILSMGRECGVIGFNLAILNGQLIVHMGSAQDTTSTVMQSVTNSTINIQPIELNTWYHVAVTVNDTTVIVYIDGQKVIDSKLVAINYATGGIKKHSYLTIGKMACNHEFATVYFPFNGSVSDVRIYDHCLSPKEIEHISQTLVLHYPMGNIDGLIGGRNLLTKSRYFGIYNNYGVPATITTLSETYNGQPIYRLSMSPTADKLLHFQTYTSAHGVNTKIRTTFLANTIYTNSIYWRPISNYDIIVGLTASNIGYWVDKKTESAGNGWNRTYATRIANEEKADWLYYSFCCPSAQVDVPLIIDFTSPKLEVNLSPTPWTPAPEDTPQFYDYTIFDTSGHGNHGSIAESTSPTWCDDSPRYSGSYSFKGKKYILTENLSTAGYKDSWTIAWWSKISNMTNKMAWGFDGNGLNFFPDSSGSFCLNTGDGGANPFRKNGIPVLYAPYNDNKWHHYTVTGSGNENLLYIDGIYSGTSIAYRSITGRNLCIGKWKETIDGYYWDGEISDFRVYATALSSTDIESLYNTSASIANNGTLLVSGEVIE